MRKCGRASASRGFLRSRSLTTGSCSDSASCDSGSASASSCSTSSTTGSSTGGASSRTLRRTRTDSFLLVDSEDSHPRPPSRPADFAGLPPCACCRASPPACRGVLRRPVGSARSRCTTAVRPIIRLPARIIEPPRAKCVSSKPRPSTPRQPPAPITGPGDRAGRNMATKAVRPTSVAIQPPKRSTGVSIGRRRSKAKSNAASETTRK